ncbi:type II toxin-antitoxin system PemK/MazF family toxin [Paenibacillus brevis]|nr:type II toxin-antitoxin system PemK/MazF family toxin [Paenibacillus brevis]
MPKRGQIWWADMGYGEGSEQFGERPVLIIQNNVGNKYSPTVIVATITDAKKRPLPTHVRIMKRQKLYKDSVVMLEQVRTIDKCRLRGAVATLTAEEMRQVDLALSISVGLVPVEGGEQDAGRNQSQS